MKTVTITVEVTTVISHKKVTKTIQITPAAPERPAPSKSSTFDKAKQALALVGQVAPYVAQIAGPFVRQ